MYLTQIHSLMHHINFGTNSTIFCATIEKGVDEKKIKDAVITVFKFYCRDMLWSYSINPLEKKERIIINDDFWESRIHIVHNQRSEDICANYQRLILDIEKGFNFHITINVKEYDTDLIIAGSHVLMDGTSNAFIVIYASLLLKKSYIKFYTAIFLGRLDFIWQRRGLDVKFTENMRIKGTTQIKQLNLEDIIVDIEQIFFNLPDKSLEVVSGLSFNKWFSSCGLVAFNNILHDQFDKINLIKMISVRNRIKGISILHFGELHMSIRYSLERCDLQNVKATYHHLCEKIKPELDDITKKLNIRRAEAKKGIDPSAYYSRRDNSTPSLGVSTFGKYKSYPFIKNVKGYAPFIQYEAPKFLLYALIHENSLMVSLTRNTNSDLGLYNQFKEKICQTISEEIKRIENEEF